MQEIKLAQPQSYFGLIEKVGSKGKYQFHVFQILFLNWFIAALLLMGTSFLFMNRTFDCIGNDIKTDNCQKTICQKDQAQWQKYLSQKEVQSLATDFGPYLCQKGNLQLDTMRMILYIGTFFGYLSFLYVTDNYGRKFSAVLTWSITTVGIFILCISQNIEMACIGLFFAGAGCQGSIRISMTIFTQILEYKKRQQYSVALQIGFGFSAMFIGALYWVIRQWRTITIFFIGIPAVIELLLLIFYIQQTPKYLVTKKGFQKAKKALNRIGKINYGQQNLITDEDIQRVYDKQQVGGQQFTFKINPLHLFTLKSLRYKTITCSLMFFFLTYLYFGPIVIVDKLGLNPFLSQIILGGSEFIAYPISYCFISKTPRIKSGYITIGISGIFTGILIFIRAPQGCQNCLEGILQVVLIFIARFCVSYYFSIIFLYITEIYPLRARGLGFGVASSFGAIASSSSQLVFTQMQERNQNPMLLFTIFAILSVITLKFMKQTLNEPLINQIKQVQDKKDAFKEKGSIQENHTPMPMLSKKNQLVEQKQTQQKMNQMNKEQYRQQEQFQQKQQVN